MIKSEMNTREGSKEKKMGEGKKQPDPDPSHSGFAIPIIPRSAPLESSVN